MNYEHSVGVPIKKCLISDSLEVRVRLSTDVPYQPKATVGIYIHEMKEDIVAKIL